MLEKLKELWAKWNVQIKVVGGVLVVATIWGTCTYEPNLSSATEEVEETEVVPVSNTTDGPDEVGVSTATEETEATTAETNQ